MLGKWNNFRESEAIRERLMASYCLIQYESHTMESILSILALGTNLNFGL